MSAWRRAGREPRHLIHAWHAELQRIASRQGDRVEMRVNRHWIAFRSENQGRAFAEIRPNRRRVEVFILPERRDLSDPTGIAKAAPQSQGWNWFRTKFSVRSNGHAGAALALLRQSYERRWTQRSSAAGTRLQGARVGSRREAARASGGKT